MFHVTIQDPQLLLKVKREKKLMEVLHETLFGLRCNSIKNDQLKALGISVEMIDILWNYP